MNFELSVFRAINHWPDWLGPFFFFWSECTKWNWVRLLILIAVIALAWKKSTRMFLTLLIISVALSNETTDGLKAFFQTDRPTVALTDAIVRTERLTSFGTASAHSANMAAVATVVWACFGWRAGVCWLLVALFTGLSRIYNGVHFPSQVLLGWGVGVLVASVVLAITRRITWLQRAKDPSTQLNQESQSSGPLR